MYKSIKNHPDFQAKYAHGYYFCGAADWSQRRDTPRPWFSAHPKQFMRQLTYAVRYPLVLMVLSSLLCNLSDSLLPILIGYNVDLLAQGKELNALIGPLALFLLLLLGYSLGNGLHQYADNGLYSGVLVRLQYQIAKRMHSGAYKISNQIGAGNLVTSIDSDTNAVTYYMAAKLLCVCKFVTSLPMLVILFKINWQLTTVLLILLPLTSVGLKILESKMQKRFEVSRKIQGELSTITNDTIAGLRILRGLGGEKTFVENYQHKSQKYRQSQAKVVMLSTMSQVLAKFSISFCLILLGTWGAWMVKNHSLTVGQIITFAGLLNYLSALLDSLTWLFWARADFKAKLPRICKIFAQPIALTHGTNKLPDSALKADIYVQDYDLLFKAGKHTAVVASNLKVATELTNSMGRLDDEQCKTILQYPDLEINVPLNQLPLAESYKTIVLSPGISQLFAGSLHQAISGAKDPFEYPEIPIEYLIEQQMHWDNPGSKKLDLINENQVLSSEQIKRLQTVVDVACAQDVVDNLHGWNGKLEEHGHNISGGQRQRLSLARALYSDPAILVLVNPTSALDSATEFEVAKNLQKYRAGRTTITVTSSPLVLHNCDEVVVLDVDGKEIARGQHTDLLKTCPNYQQLLNTQFQSSTAKEGN